MDRDFYEGIHAVSDWRRIAFHLRNQNMPQAAHYIADITAGYLPNDRVTIVVHGPMLGRIIADFLAGCRPPIRGWPEQPPLFTPTPSRATEPAESTADAVDAWLAELRHGGAP
jgi:hypothetical protein